MSRASSTAYWRLESGVPGRAGKAELARDWGPVVEVRTSCWEGDFIYWALVSQVGFLFK